MNAQATRNIGFTCHPAIRAVFVRQHEIREARKRQMALMRHWAFVLARYALAGIAAAIIAALLLGVRP